MLFPLHLWKASAWTGSSSSQSFFQTVTCPWSCLNVSFSGLQKEHQTPPPASSKRRNAQTGRHLLRWTLRSLSTTKKAPASWMQPLPYHRIWSVSVPAGNTLQSSLLVSGQTHLDKSCDIYSVIQTHVWWFICSSDSFLLGKKIQSLP